MNSSNFHKKPSLFTRLYSVWYRHIRVYNSNFWSNAFPPFFEPLIFLAGLGLGFARYIPDMAGIPYIIYLGSGLIVTSAMYTAAFECSYGTFIRLEFDRVYDGMLGAPISAENLIIGEIIFAGTKGFFFSIAVLAVVWGFGIITHPLSILSAFAGLLTGLMFATASIYITSFIKNINHFNFFFTGILSPMFFFSGVIFPVEELPAAAIPVAEVLPLTHAVRLARAFCVPELLSPWLLLDLLYCVVFIIITGWLGVRAMKRRIIL